jgi:SAM-dependent methyltransferase
MASCRRRRRPPIVPFGHTVVSYQRNHDARTCSCGVGQGTLRGTRFATPLSMTDRERGLMQPMKRWLGYRSIGRALNLANQIAKELRTDAHVLDVGCGSGFVAHHLNALLDRTVTGVDVMSNAQAPIHYQPFDGEKLPFRDGSFDAVLFCYVLHHSERAPSLLREARRVLKSGGRMIIYEDIPERWHDKVLCWWHERQWLLRTGPCTFLSIASWQSLFEVIGLRLVRSLELPRWRDPTHPVLSCMFVLEPV